MQRLSDANDPDYLEQIANHEKGSLPTGYVPKTIDIPIRQPMKPDLGVPPVVEPILENTLAHVVSYDKDTREGVAYVRQGYKVDFVTPYQLANRTYEVGSEVLLTRTREQDVYRVVGHQDAILNEFIRYSSAVMNKVTAEGNYTLTGADEYLYDDFTTVLGKTITFPDDCVCHISIKFRVSVSGRMHTVTAVNLTNTGGVSGIGTGTCTFVYTATDPHSGTNVGTSLTPLSRQPGFQLVAATKGLWCPVLGLVYANETIAYGDC